MPRIKKISFVLQSTKAGVPNAVLFETYFILIKLADHKAARHYIWQYCAVNNFTSYSGNQILAWRADILTKVFHGFPQFLQAMQGKGLKLGHDYFLPHLFQFINHLSPLHLML
jgi:hypothetical protein